MPATKIETGVWIEHKHLHLTLLARQDKPEDLAVLAQSIKVNQVQLGDIIVCPKDETLPPPYADFDVLAGGRRKRAEEELLGWDKGRCTIMYGLTPFEKLQIMRDENKARRDTTPLEDARLYQAMLDSEEGLTQEKLAEREGMTRGTLSNYLSLLTLPANVQGIADRSANIGLRHLLQICRLNGRENDQIELIQKADQEDWTVKQLTAEVSKRLGGGGKAKKEAKKDQADMVWKGEGLHINRPFRPKDETIEEFVAWLMPALKQALKDHPVGALSKDGQKSINDLQRIAHLAQTGEPPAAPEDHRVLIPDSSDGHRQNDQLSADRADGAQKVAQFKESTPPHAKSGPLGLWPAGGGAMEKAKQLPHLTMEQLHERLAARGAPKMTPAQLKEFMEQRMKAVYGDQFKQNEEVEATDDRNDDDRGKDLPA